jgi:hypothetical protein
MRIRIPNTETENTRTSVSGSLCVTGTADGNWMSGDVMLELIQCIECDRAARFLSVHNSPIEFLYEQATIHTEESTPMILSSSVGDP